MGTEGIPHLRLRPTPPDGIRHRRSLWAEGIFRPELRLHVQNPHHRKQQRGQDIFPLPLCRRLLHACLVSTVGIDFKVKTIYRNDKRIKLQIWVGPAGGPSGSITLPRQEQQPQLCLFLSCLDSLITYWAFMRCLLCTRGYRHRRECPVSPISALQGWGRGKCWVLSYP